MASDYHIRLKKQLPCLEWHQDAGGRSTGRDRQQSSRMPCGPGNKQAGPRQPKISTFSNLMRMNVKKLLCGSSFNHVFFEICLTLTSAFLDSAAYSMASLKRLSWTEFQLIEKLGYKLGQSQINNNSRISPGLWFATWGSEGISAASPFSDSYVYR